MLAAMKPPCMLERLGAHYPDIHAKAIAEHFGDAPHPEGEAALAEALDRINILYVICFTNRCGSHFLGQAMASDGRLKAVGEALNSEVVIGHSTQRGIQSYAGYLAWLVGHLRSKQGYSGIKASVGQLISLYNTGMLSALGKRLRLIYLVRDDLLDQAISLYIASQTKQWTSLQKSNGAEVAYDVDALMNVVANLSSQNSAFQALFQLWGVQPLTVHYEGFAEDPARRIKRIGRFLDLPDLRYVPEKITYAKQADALNAQMKARLLSDLSLSRT
jgi:LPS sulfotransferase NodH